MRERRTCHVYVCVCVFVCVCIAYPPASSMLEMETNAEQSISLSYSRHNFILAFSTAYYCTSCYWKALNNLSFLLQIILTIFDKNYRTCAMNRVIVWKFFRKSQSSRTLRYCQKNIESRYVKIKKGKNQINFFIN